MDRARLPLVWTLWVICLSAGTTPLWAQQTDDTAILHAKALSQAFRRAAERSSPPVVTVVVKTKPTPPPSGLRDLLDDPRLRGLFPDGVPQEGNESQPNPEWLPPSFHVGSGVIVDTGGVILTNHHVIEGAEEIIVRLGDGSELPSSAVVSDPMSDLAIVRVRSDAQLPAAKFGDSDDVSIGDWVIAIGSPFELETTVSAGIISAKGRGIDKIKRGRLFQTDAAINPGNSGGPLVNLDGEVIGISTAIATSNGGYQGVGFAIPGNRAQWIWKELEAHGKVRRAYLGIGIDELTAADASSLATTARAGVWVRRVYEDGPGAAAGLRENDVIVEFAGVNVRMPRDLQDVVEQSPIATPLPMKLLRDGQQIQVDVELRPFEE